eukprot:TRINITY_DN8806_c0_g1_i1.p1 TRINITY_DN8806_c0_g1~~TRINITY_DN8806_c0_g1_i1.p1  ORF type:complete len:216 (+),score=48.88 TRINITY_DN8806_c0_g1_i1:102-749(+)
MSTSMETDHPNILYDALPYLDTSYTPEKKAQAERLIQQEMRTFTPRTEAYQPIVLDFKSELLQKEWELVSKNGDYSTPPLPMDKYNLNPPQDENDLKAWEKSLDMAKISVEHHLNRVENMELLKTYGANAWIAYNQQLERIQQKLQVKLDSVKNEIEELNRLRKREQEEAGQKIKHLEDRWNEMVRGNLRIDGACLKLKSEIEDLKDKKRASEVQ